MTTAERIRQAVKSANARGDHVHGLEVEPGGKIVLRTQTAKLRRSLVEATPITTTLPERPLGRDSIGRGAKPKPFLFGPML